MTTILIADDISENRYLLVAMFKGSGYEVVAARDGAEALASALASPPDLIVADILMPVMDGLELCRRVKTDKIITGYGGTIDVTSEEGKGTAFVIRLPAAADRIVDAGETSRLEGEAPGIRGRILVIDDEPALRSALKRMLAAHDVVEADSGQRAREILSEDQRFDVILCDVMIPKGSGVETHRWLSAEHPPLARNVVFVTGATFTPNAKQYLDSVDNLRLDKPLDARAVQRMVAERVVAGRGRG